MDQVLHSETLPDYKAEITNTVLAATIAQLKSQYPKLPLNLKEWGTGHVAVSVAVDVALPQFHDPEEIDIKSQEPIIIVFNLKQYPYRAPSVYPDRLTFPRTKLGHLYIAVKGRPPQFCLVRGGMDIWYADKQIKDLVSRVKNWLREAATGELNENGDEFEPLRLEGYSGTLNYDYGILHSICKEKNAYLPLVNYAKLFFERISTGKQPLSWKYIEVVKAEKIVEKLKEVADDAGKEDGSAEKKFLYFGYVLWADNDDSIDSYDVNLPRDWESFKAFCIKHSIPTDSLEKELVLSKPLRLYNSVPIIVAIKRPKKIIGLPGDIEFINFHLHLPNEKIIENVIAPDCSVSFKEHKQPLNLKKASEISGHPEIIEGTTLVAGCGALGSRIALHLGKSGYTDMWFADDDTLMPHNFVRHPLSVKYLNKNKADALSDEINDLYEDSSKKAFGFPTRADFTVSHVGEKKIFKRIFDFTASPTFAQLLAVSKFHEDVTVLKAYISDFGKLGLLLIEGAQRNPRHDDLQVLLYYQAIENPSIEDWLTREFNAAEKTTNIMVGLGCNSETTVLSDEEVACHSSILSSLIRQNLKGQPLEFGQVFTNRLFTEPHFHTQTAGLSFKKLDVYNAVNDASWQVRFANDMTERLNKQMAAASPMETGGLFIGSCNYKTKTIHVVDLIDAPPDSHANEVCFFRGIDGLADKLDVINEKTGNQLGYVGEWHSHPKGPGGPSATDMATVKKFKNYYANQPTPLPVFLTIITPKSILPFVY
ncbi:MAG: Mov34/MPN/PAD-1 family protein [Bacteroidota bacterium]